MATIFRALMTAVLLLFAWAAWLGLHAADVSGSAAHESAGLVAALVATLGQSVPFAYFLGTGFWIRAFARASRAGPEWEARHRGWIESRSYPLMYLPPAFTVAAAISGMLVGSGRAPLGVHLACVIGAVAATAVALVVVPRAMRRNSALMDELADRHQVPRPATPAYEQLVQEEEAKALPPLFQLSRLLLFFSVQLVLIWLYLRLGTESWRGAPLAPFAAPAVALLTLGLGLNAIHDPNKPATPARAWARALAVGGAAGALAVVAVFTLG
jgi:hypothetical protein